MRSWRSIATATAHHERPRDLVHRRSAVRAVRSGGAVGVRHERERLAGRGRRALHGLPGLARREPGRSEPGGRVASLAEHGISAIHLTRGLTGRHARRRNRQRRHGCIRVHPDRRLARRSRRRRARVPRAAGPSRYAGTECNQRGAVACARRGGGVPPFRSLTAPARRRIGRGHGRRGFDRGRGSQRR